MKLRTKQREGSKVHRTYDQAQTPLQRLLTSGVLTADQQHELGRVTQALDPLRLLQQLEQLQKALWRHAVRPGVSSESSGLDSLLPFSVQQCAEHDLSAEGITAPRPSQALRRRGEERIKKVGGLVIGAPAQTPLREASSRSRPGLSSTQNGPECRSSRN